MFSLYLLDLDGLLIDTEKLHFQAYRNMCSDRGAPLPWNFDQFIQNAHAAEGGLEKALYGALPQLWKSEANWEILYREKQLCFDKIISNRSVGLLPGAKRLLQWLKSKDLAHGVVTNSRRHHVELFKKQCAELRSIPRFWAREDYSEPKPSPSGYLTALRSFQIPPHRAMGFEDSAKGLNSLLKAGVKGAYINAVAPLNGDQEPFSSPHWDHFPSLDAWLNEQKEI